jgi:IMP dehydrogenase
VAEIEIGIGKNARRAYDLAEVGIVPSRRTRDREEVSMSWEIDAYRLDLPFLASPMDSVVSPQTAIEIGRLGGVGVLNLEGVWTRYDDPDPILDELAKLEGAEAFARLREVYTEPIRDDLIRRRIEEVRAAGVITAAALSPQHTVRHHRALLEAHVDLFVIQGTTVSAEFNAVRSDPDNPSLNLKKFISDLDVPVIVGGCASYSTALHLMRTGAAGLLVGIGPGRSSGISDVLGVGVPMATAIADAAGARMRYLDESGGRYVHVIASGGMTTSGDIAKAIVCGADAVMLGAPLARAHEAPGRGWHWGTATVHRELPRGARIPSPPVGTLEEILVGPANGADGTTNLFGALRRSMATTGYGSLKEFQKADLMLLHN